ncbi:MAG: prepilin peptidase, partial [Planctomycetota bacterium]|nr:prepilin peptidase [Planctomycetota bacterium]
MRKRRSHATPVLVLAVVYVGVGVLTYSLTLGAIDYLLGLNAANKEPGIPFGPLAYSRSGYEFFVWDRFVEAIAGVWFFALGASIGSFLNVVACRLPLNKGLVREGSSCPYCLRPIL